MGRFTEGHFQVELRYFKGIKNLGMPYVQFELAQSVNITVKILKHYIPVICSHKPEQTTRVVKQKALQIWLHPGSSANYMV